MYLRTILNQALQSLSGLHLRVKVRVRVRNEALQSLSSLHLRVQKVEVTVTERVRGVRG